MTTTDYQTHGVLGLSTTDPTAVHRFSESLRRELEENPAVTPAELSERACKIAKEHGLHVDLHAQPADLPEPWRGDLCGARYTLYCAGRYGGRSIIGTEGWLLYVPDDVVGKAIAAGFVRVDVPADHFGRPEGDALPIRVPADGAIWGFVGEQPFAREVLAMLVREGATHGRLGDQRTRDGLTVRALITSAGVAMPCRLVGQEHVSAQAARAAHALAQGLATAETDGATTIAAAMLEDAARVVLEPDPSALEWPTTRLDAARAAEAWVRRNSEAPTPTLSDVANFCRLVAKHLRAMGAEA